jgi:protein-disulfide isomerase
VSDPAARQCSSLGFPLALAVLCLVPTLALADASGGRAVSLTTVSTILADLPPTHSSGAEHADITIIEYFDYNCPVCRRVEPDLRRLVAQDPKVRWVHKDWPVFGEASRYAAFSAFAAARLGKYSLAHDALMGSRRDLDSAEDVQATLRAAGLDVTAIDADVTRHSREYADVLARNAREAATLGLRGTPALIVGDQVISGVLDLPRLQKLIADSRRRSGHR